MEPAREIPAWAYRLMAGSGRLRSTTLAARTTCASAMTARTSATSTAANIRSCVQVIRFFKPINNLQEAGIKPRFLQLLIIPVQWITTLADTLSFQQQMVLHSFIMTCKQDPLEKIKKYVIIRIQGRATKLWYSLIARRTYKNK